MSNNFLLPAEAYQRSIDPLGDWLKQTSWYASKQLNIPYEKAIEHLRGKLRSKEIKIDDPRVVFFHREENGDRFKKTAPLSQYLGKAIREGNILAPTGTTYLHPDVKRSVIVEYLDENVALRKKYKKTSQAAEAAGDIPKYKYFNNAQDNAKRDNNAVSGGFVAEGSIINNRSAHSTLTSITRSIASLSNMSNERLVEGNRHYYCPDVIKNNIVSICSASDYNTIKEAMELFNLKYPTIDDMMDCITRSSDLYFKDTRKIDEIRSFVVKLNELERAAFVYTGDLYHLRILNNDFLRQFITDLSSRGDETPVEDVRNKIHKLDEQVVNYAHQVCLTMMKGKGKDYDLLSDTEAYILYNTCQNIISVIDHYKLLIKAFFLTKHSPCTMATVPDMVRRSVVLSDTDSTMFSVDGWVIWYFGKLNFKDEGYAVAGSIMYMATQAIAHILAQFSANLNVERSRLFTLQMKPEFVFPVFAQTSVAKHYYTAMMVKEGSVYEKIKMEVKGVHMKDSTVPKNIIDGAAAHMKRVIETIMAGEDLSLYDILQATVDTEEMIMTSMKKGETTYLKRIRIKERSAYKNGQDAGVDKTNFRHYTLWKTTFAPKYGEYPPPPYDAVTVPIKLTSNRVATDWLASLEDRTFASNFAKWMLDHNIAKLQQLHLPGDYCRSYGIPEELTSIIDYQRIVLALTRSYRNVIESHGYFPKNETMISDQVNQFCGTEELV